MAHHRTECLAAGMDGLVAKPVDLRLLIGAIEAAVSGSPGDVAAQAESRLAS